MAGSDTNHNGHRKNDLFCRKLTLVYGFRYHCAKKKKWLLSAAATTSIPKIHRFPNISHTERDLTSMVEAYIYLWNKYSQPRFNGNSNTCTCSNNRCTPPILCTYTNTAVILFNKHRKSYIHSPRMSYNNINSQRRPTPSYGDHESQQSTESNSRKMSTSDLEFGQ